MSKVQERNRLTCVLNLYHEQGNEEPEGLRLAFSVNLATSVEGYTRRMKVGTQPVELDLGWIAPEDAGCIVIENLEGRGLQALPSDEELQDIELRVIEILQDDRPNWIVAPRRFFFGFPADAAGIKLRSRHGVVKFRLTILPR